MLGSWDLFEWVTILRSQLHNLAESPAHRLSLAESDRWTIGCNRLLLLGTSAVASSAIAESGTPATPRASLEAAKVGGTLSLRRKEVGTDGMLPESASSSNLKAHHSISSCRVVRKPGCDIIFTNISHVAMAG